MPQLDPTPWFTVLFFSWTVFLIATPFKVNKYRYLNDPSLKPFKGLNKPWYWPWP